MVEEFKGYKLQEIHPVLGIEKAKSVATGVSRMIDQGLRDQDRTKPFQPFVIFEDDVSIYREFPTELVIPDDADILYIGISRCSMNATQFCYENFFEPVDANIVRVENMLSAHAVLLCSAAGTNAFQRAIAEAYFTVQNGDIPTAYMQSYYNVYALREPLVYQDAAYGGCEMETKFTLSQHANPLPAAYRIATYFSVLGYNPPSTFTLRGTRIDNEYPFLHKIRCTTDIDIYFDTYEYTDNTHKKIYIQLEPFSIHNCRDYLQQNSHKYDYVLCHDGSVAPTNGISFCPAATWIDPHYYRNVDTTRKRYQISHMAGFKDWTLGHKIRKELHMQQLALTCDIPITFFRSWIHPQLPNINNNPFIPENPATHCTNHNGLSRTSKVVLFEDFQFSIIVENTSETNYFSEKLIDCILMKTIPIYYGCPNIGDFFNTAGWICLTSTTPEAIVAEVKEKLGQLSDTHYTSYASVIEENYAKALQLCDCATNIIHALMKTNLVALR